VIPVLLTFVDEAVQKIKGLRRRAPHPPTEIQT